MARETGREGGGARGNGGRTVTARLPVGRGWSSSPECRCTDEQNDRVLYHGRDETAWRIQRIKNMKNPACRVHSTTPWSLVDCGSLLYLVFKQHRMGVNERHCRSVAVHRSWSSWSSWSFVTFDFLLFTKLKRASRGQQSTTNPSIHPSIYLPCINILHLASSPFCRYMHRATRGSGSGSGSISFLVVIHKIHR